MPSARLTAMLPELSTVMRLALPGDSLVLPVKALESLKVRSPASTITPSANH